MTGGNLVLNAMKTMCTLLELDLILSIYFPVVVCMPQTLFYATTGGREISDKNLKSVYILKLNKHKRRKIDAVCR